MQQTKTSTSEHPALVCTDWGLSSRRVWVLSSDGRVLHTHRDRVGTRAIAQAYRGKGAQERAKAFEASLDALLLDIDEFATQVPVLACGMVGSNLGWAQAQYRATPASLDMRVDDLTVITRHGRAPVYIIPGLAHQGSPIADTMRGEETQILGILCSQSTQQDMGARTIVLPGTHSKWVEVNGGTIKRFTTAMTGEFFRLVMEGSVIAEPAIHCDYFDEKAFYDGVDLASQHPELGLAAQLFSARTLILNEELMAHQIRDYISGVIIGAEVERMNRIYGDHGREIIVCGDRKLTNQYKKCLEKFGYLAILKDEENSLQGLRCVAQQTQLLSHSGDEK